MAARPGQQRDRQESVIRHEAVRYGPWESDYAAVEMDNATYNARWDRKNRPNRDRRKREKTSTAA